MFPQSTKISIPHYETVESVEYYVIQVTCSNKDWNVRHRFKDFSLLHDKLQKEVAITKDLLPGKKILKTAKFLDQRKDDLEKYLRTVQQLVQSMPPLEMVQFLDFDKYDTVFVLQKIAMELQSIQNNKHASFTIFEIHAISERLRLPCPAFQLHDSTYDFSHVLDYCSQVEYLKIIPSTQSCSTKEEYLHHLISPIGHSNILPSTLSFELTPFTCVRSMSLLGIVPQNVTKCDPVRSKVENLEVKFTRAQNIQQILCPEMIHDSSITAESMSMYSWKNVKTANFECNDIWTIDGAIKLIPNVQELNLNDNRLSMANLSSLHNLRILNLSGNLIESVKDWHMLLGNVEVLNLSSNKIKSLEGLNRLISLRRLDLSFNEIADIEQSEFIAMLPVLENISLQGNPLILEVDYRAKVLARFGERCADIILDNEKCTSNEIDKALILSALRMTKLR